MNNNKNENINEEAKTESAVVSVKARLLEEIKNIKNESYDFGKDLVISEVHLENTKLTETVDEIFIKLKEQYTHTHLLISNLVGGKSLTEQESEKRIKYLLDWMARATRPEQGKLDDAIVFRGNERTGKTALPETFFKYLFNNYVTFDNSKLKSEFNTGIDGAEFIFCEEVDISYKKSSKTFFKLKEYITDSLIELITKNKDSEIVNNSFNMMFAQNMGNSLELEYPNRRYTVFVTGEDSLFDLVSEKFGYQDIDGEFFGRIRDFERDDFLKDLLNISCNKS